MTIDKATTAADLRNAALVMDHLGRGVGTFMSPDDGSVCLDGAIRIAVSTRPVHHACYWTLDEEDVRDPRHLAATHALAAILPDHCTVVHLHDCPFTLWRQSEFPGPEEQVYHYSDHVCDGTKMSVDVLIEAAEKLEADLP